jgi:antitoxin component YwqK of YwqJK toxin-antitoxin module
MRDKGMNMFGEQEDKVFSSKKFKKAVRANPYPFLVQRQSMDQDIIPMLDPIPDGKYIQYYKSFCFLKEDGACDFRDDQIAGYFTIKDNALDGEATWVNIAGDTLKHGFFAGGLKVDEWKIVFAKLGYFGLEEAETFIETGNVESRYDEMLVTFTKGVAEGSYQKVNQDGITLEKGAYTDGEESGEWTLYSKYPAEEYLKAFDGIYPVEKHFVINSDDLLIAHPFLIRSGLHNAWEHDPAVYNFFPEYDIPSLPGLYEPAFPIVENFELEEEIYDDSFSEMEYYEEEYYDEGMYGEYELEGFAGGLSYFESTILDPNTNKQVLRGDIFDSLGAYPNYLEVHETFYRNGQLAYRYEFENGNLKEEPIIYWDNGNVHDEIKFIADSNHYLRTIYDYDGKEFSSFLYDSAGYYKISNHFDGNRELIEIDGLKFYHTDYDRKFHYSIPDSVLEFVSVPNTITDREWHLIDTTLIEETILDPVNRTANYYAFSLFGDTLIKSERIYAEDYGSWTGKRTRQAGPFTLSGVRSASLYDWLEVDSIPILMTNRYRSFNVDADYELLYEGERLTGPMEYKFKGKKYKFKKDQVTIPNDEKAWDKFAEELIFYRILGEQGKLKKKHREIASVQYNSRMQYEQFSSLYDNLFNPVFSTPFDLSSGSYDDYYWEEEMSGEASPFTEKIEGYFLDGKPEGIWRSYDQFGKVRMEVNYSNGALNGKIRKYTYSDPMPEEYYYYEEEQDSFPEKRTYYLAEEYNYKNDMRDGAAYDYNWYGEILQEQHFKEGYLEGLTTERNDIATSFTEYKDGYRDGYSRTYLTLPGKDSILLFDLNFQNGALQGESASYHTNGKISKRGFFLQGEPIEDYEGYDSLGFKYHYVKFEYGFPIEEKLWEENELSVRYTFDWKDSIEFIPMNLTDSESLDALLVEAGLSDGWEYQPYLGRQTIVDKGGIDYHLTKYFPNDTVSRDGEIVKGKKSGHWDFFSYEGEKLYEVNYFDTLLVINDSVKFNAKGIYADYDSLGNELYRAYIIEKSERFDCSHKDHYEVRQFYTISEANDSLGRMNGEVFNFYDNGTLQSYGKMKDGLPDGDWRYYDPAGKLNKYGAYVQGKREGRWLSGDLSKTKYLGDICLNPNMPDVEETLRFRENFLDIQIINYRMGREKGSEYYDINMNRFIENSDDGEDMETEIDEE